MPRDSKTPSLIEFQQKFSTEQSCIEYLARVRWPKGYVCAKCGSPKFYQLNVKPRIFQCAQCRHQESVTAGTILHRTRTPLIKWFWAAYLMARDKRGVSAMYLSRELALRYATAWAISHKLRHALGENGDFLLEGVVEVDETYYGGKGGSGSSGRSLSNPNKSLLVMAVERRLAGKKQGYGIKNTGFVAGSARLAVIPAASSEHLKSFLKANLKKGTNIITDGWSGYSGASDHCEHESAVQGDGRDSERILPLVHLQFSNFKAWLNGTYHGVSSKHLPSYAREWNYRFNRRKRIDNLFDYVMKRLINKPTITYRQIVEQRSLNVPLHGLMG